MAALELVLIRHAQTTANAAQVLAGWTDVELTQRGVEQAARLRGQIRGLEVDSQWSSDLKRTRHTAELAWEEPAWSEAHYDERIRELNFGDYEGRSWTTLSAQELDQIRGFRDFRAPGGESIAEFRARILSFVEGLGSGRHLLFTHGGVIRLLMSGMGVQRFVGNCAYVHLDWTNQNILEEREGGH